MRILVISNLYPAYYLGGAELLCQQVAEHLAGRGHEVEILTSTFRTQVLRAGHMQEEVNGLKVLRFLRLQLSFDVPIRKSFSRLGRISPDYANIRTTRRVLREYRPDLVFAWSQRRLGVAPIRICQKLEFPTAFIFNDDSPCAYAPRRFEWTNPKAWIRFATDRTLFRRNTTAEWNFQFVTCISTCLKDQLLRRGIPVENAEVIHQGIPIEDFPAKGTPGGVNAPIRLLYVGQLYEGKGVHTVVKACAHLASQLGSNAIELSVVGDGADEYVRSLRGLVSTGTVVNFLGKVAYDELARIYREHDIFVFSSICQEGFGLTFLEAMASGTTVISTTTGGQAECLRDGENALTFPAGDSFALADRILYLVSEPGLSTRLALEARRMVERDYSLDGYVDKLEHFLYQCHREHCAQAQEGNM